MNNEELVCRIQANEDREDCLNELCDSLRPLIACLVNRYAIDPDDKPDLMQQGYIGLIEAAERYDPDAETKFSTWATYWIKSEILLYLSGGVLHIPRGLRDMISRIQRYEADFERDTGRKPTTNEAAAALDLSPDQVTRARAAASVSTVRSLSEPIDDGLELADTVGAADPTPEDVVTDQEGRRILWGLVSDLEPIESDIIRRRYRDNSSRANCAEVLDLTPEKVRQIEQKALYKLERKRWRLESFYDEYIFNHVYAHTSLGFFKASGMTEQEWIYLHKYRDRK